MLTYIVLFRLLQGASEAAAPVRIGPLSTLNIFQSDITMGDFNLGEILGTFREPTDEGDLKP